MTRGKTFGTLLFKIQFILCSLLFGILKTSKINSLLKKKISELVLIFSQENKISGIII